MGTVTTYFAGESDLFLKAVEESRGGLRRLVAELSPAAAATDRFNKQQELLDGALKRGRLTMEQHTQLVGRLRSKYDEAVVGQRAITGSSGQMRAGMQQLSFQIGDVATQFASGTKPMVIFAQQGGQVIQALGMMTSKTTGLLGLLGGPWGQIITAALVVLTPFVSKLFQGADAARDAAKGTDEYTAALKRLQEQAGSFDFGSDEFSKVQKAYLESEARVGRLRAERGTAPTNAVGFITPGAPGAVTQAVRSRAQIDAELKNAEADRDNRRGAITGLMMQRRNRATLNGSDRPARTRSRGGPADRSDNREERFDDQAARLEDQRLELLKQLVDDTRERGALEDQQIKAAQASYEADVAHQVAQREITKAQGERLVLASRENTELKQQIADRRYGDEFIRDQVKIDTSTLDIKRDGLELDLANARTSKDRRRIQLELLRIDIERQRIALEGVRDQATTSKIDRQIAVARLAQLAEIERKETARVERSNMSPGEQYLDSLPRSLDELNEAFEGVATDGLKSLNDGLVDAIMGTKSLGEAFKNVASQIIADLLRIAIQQQIVKPLGEALFGGGGGGFSLGNLFGGGGGGKDIGGLVSKLGKLPGFASGGSFMVGGRGGIDSQLLSIGGMPRAWVSPTEQINVRNPANDQGSGRGGIAAIVPSPLFDVVMDGKVLSTGGQMMQQSARSNMRRSQQSLLGRR